MNKFPSIPHLSFSPQINEDDTIMTDTKVFIGGSGSYKLCIHEKLDGGNCCIFKGNVFARTHKHPTKHPWFNTIKDLIRSQPLFYDEEYYNLMIFGENMTAIHSISYTNLTSYLYIFAVYDPSTNNWFSLKDINNIANNLNIPTVPLLFEGNFISMKEIKDWMNKEIQKPSVLGCIDREGFVVRSETAFSMETFDKYMAKYVRKGHVQTDKNWIRKWKKVQLSSYTNKKHKQQKKKVKKHKRKASLKTSLIVCCGIPGSGKSTFAKHLSQYRHEWERAGTDLFGKQKNAVFSFVARISKNHEKKCIVENCNVTVSKRIEILDCAFKPSDAICVYFDIHQEECAQRTRNRHNHETKQLFKSAKGNKIITSFSKQLQTPTIKEGFKHVVMVRNDDDINGLLRRLGVKEAIQSSYAMHMQHKEEDKQNNDLYIALMAKTRCEMNVDVLCNKLKLNRDDVLNVYVIGSRVWGTATCASDWDFVIVTNVENERVFVSTGNVDAYILDKYQWKRELNNHRFVCWLTLFLPKQAIWKQRLSVADVNKESLSFDESLNDVRVRGFGFKLFVDAVSREIEKDIKKIKKLYSKNKLHKLQKTFIHTARMISVCKHIIIILLQDRYEINDNHIDIDIECHSFDDKAFIGKIKFDEIENIVIQNKKRIQNTNKEQKTCAVWINSLQQGMQKCKNLIS